MSDGLTRGWVGGAADSGAVSMLERAARFNHGLAPRDSLLVQAAGQFAALGGAKGGAPPFDVQRALFATLHEAVRRYPTDPVVWFALGDAQYHWGWGPQVGVPEREVVRSFDRAIALDSSFAPAYIHAIEMAFRYGTPNGRRYLSAYLAQNPTDVDAEGMRLLSRLADPALANTSETRQMLDAASAVQLRHAAAATMQWGDSAESIVRLGRLMSAARRRESQRQLDSVRLGHPSSFALSLRGHALDAMAAGPAPELIAELGILGAIPPAQADSAIVPLVTHNKMCGECAISLLGTIGDTTTLRRLIHVGDSLLKAPHPVIDVRQVPFALGLANAYITLANRDSTRALQQFMALPDSICHACGFGWLTTVQLLESRGRNAEAAAILDELGVFDTVLGIFTELERGRVAERLNDKPRARDAYAFVAGMWQNGDPVFQGYVAEARAGLKRLSDESSGTNIPVRKP
jgi:serine/threonine-protein kinase